MPTWKILITIVLGFICLSLAIAVIVFPMTEGAGDHWLLWMLALVAATGVMGTIFTLFLRSADRVYHKF